MGQGWIQGVSGVILAGGQSRRMGRDKRFLDFEGEPLLSRVHSLLQPLFSEVLIVAAKPCPGIDAVGCRVVTDLVPGAGSLGGLFTGLEMATQPRIFAVACDMPFLEAGVIRRFASYSTADIVVAQVKGRIEPLHAVYSKRCLPHLRTMIAQGTLRIHELLRVVSLSRHLLTEDELGDDPAALLSFLNVNTPQDLEQASRLLTAPRPVQRLCPD